MNNPVGVLQGRLTPSNGRGVQFFPYEAWQEEFSAAARIGLDCIELLIQRKDWGNTEHPLLSESGIAAICKISADSGITVPSIHAYYEPRDTYLLELPTIVHAAHAVGAKVVLLSFFKHAALDSSETKKVAREHIASVAPLLAPLQIRLGFEAELPAQELIEFIDSFPHPEMLGVYYDLGNQYARGFPVANEIRLLGNRIVGVHIKDRLQQEEGGSESASVPIAEGCADFPEAFAALKDIGYSGALILQGARIPGMGEEAIVGSYAKKVRNMLHEIY